MTCPHCATTTTELPKRTLLGYHIFRCAACQRQFNERTDTPFNFLEFPTDVVLLVVLWRLLVRHTSFDRYAILIYRTFSYSCGGRHGKALHRGITT